MTLAMPVLHTERLKIRPFTMEDLEAIYLIFDCDLFPPPGDDQRRAARQEREKWLQWTVLGYGQRASLGQPPYGERAVVRKSDDLLIGAVGFVPCLNEFGRLPSFDNSGELTHRSTPEFGLYYAIASAHQGTGYATEATRAMIAYALEELHVRRIVATTTYDNQASMGVMRKVGLRIEKNPSDNPPWLQVVGSIQAGSSNAAPVST
jgi:RimJ/RimL family protein N-acetyltransferase